MKVPDASLGPDATPRDASRDRAVGNDAAAPPDAAVSSDSKTAADTGGIRGRVSTFAGTGTEGFANGLAASAKFSKPIGLALDATGKKLYVGDFGNHRIRVIEGGAVKTFAGTGAKGFKDGPATLAQFNGPQGVGVTSTGDVIVADSGNGRVRVISKGSVVTLAGNGTLAIRDGPVATASFQRPGWVFSEPTPGSVYVADSSKLRIMSSGRVSTRSLGAQAILGITADRSGKVHIARTGGVQVLSGTTATTLAGVVGLRGFADGAATVARFETIQGIAFDKSGVLYLADFENHRVRTISKGVVATTAGKTKGFADGATTSALFNGPAGIAVDPGGTRLFVADSGNNRIRLVLP